MRGPARQERMGTRMSTDTDRRELGVPARLGLYGAILLVVFAAAYVLAGALVPDETVQRWTEHSAPVPGTVFQTNEEVAA